MEYNSISNINKGGPQKPFIETIFIEKENEKMKGLKSLSLAIILSSVAIVVFANQTSFAEESRQQLFKEFITDSQWVADTTQDQQALEIMRFAKERGKFTVLTQTGLSIPNESEKRDKGSFGILVTIPGDENINAEISYILSNKYVGASFNPDYNLLIIRGTTKMSKAFRGIQGLHMLAYAKNYTENPYDWNDLPTFCREAVKVHEFQNRITDILGGPKFVRFLNKKVVGIKLPADTNFENEVVVIRNQRLNVDKFFDKALSDFETDYRGTSLSIELNFKLLERNFKGDIAEKKAMSLAERYIEAGFLPGQ
jgi:hypothetical protein